MVHVTMDKPEEMGNRRQGRDANRKTKPEDRRAGIAKYRLFNKEIVRCNIFGGMGVHRKKKKGNTGK